MSSWRLMLVAALAWGQSVPPSVPTWLVAYPGAEVVSSSTPDVVRITYTVTATPAEVVAHYRTLFEVAAVDFQPNPDGIGTSIRASVPDCDLLITVRERSSGTQVQVSCSVRSSYPAGAVVSVTRGTTQRAGTVKRDLGENHRRMMAEAEASHRGRVEGMRKFDKPVRVESSGKNSFYRDDAPPLEWPSWLVHMGIARQPKPAYRTVYGETFLESRATTPEAMTDLYQFYEDLFKANGYSVGPARISTGHTIGGRIIQNKSGFVEACRVTDGTVAGPKTCLKAGFNRNYLNEPITVTLQVRVKGSFGRR